MTGIRRLVRLEAEANNLAMLISRVSDRKQRDGASLNTQEEKQREYARSTGLKIVAVQSFQESAKDSELRHQFHAAIARALREGIGNVVFYVCDRVARNFTDGEMLEKHVRAGKFKVHIAASGNVLHKDSDSSEFMLRLQHPDGEAREPCTCTPSHRRDGCIMQRRSFPKSPSHVLLAAVGS